MRRCRENLLTKSFNHPLGKIFAPLYALCVAGRGDFLSVVLVKEPVTSR